MVLLNRIYTKTGDGGTTRLASGAPVSKADARVEAYGVVDELNAVIGLARLYAPQEGSGRDAELGAMLARLQNELFDLGADLATPPTDAAGPEALRPEALRIVESQVARLEDEIDAFNGPLAPLTSFILPAGSPLATHLHLARTVGRRAERAVVRARAEGAVIGDPALKYLNRLSDLLFVAARAANGDGADDVLWRPAATRARAPREGAQREGVVREGGADGTGRDAPAPPAGSTAS